MYNTKIDAIDHHLKAPDGHGGTCRGWHRHKWDPATKTCERFREELPEFDPGDTIELFISRCCEVMRIRGEAEKGADL